MRRVGIQWRLRSVAFVLMAVLVGSLGLSAGVVGAQDGPQFGNWGPGMAAPDQEGIESAAPSSSGSSSSDAAQAERYGAPAAAAPGAAAVAPPPGGSGGCSYDLRGSWWNDGRMSSGGPTYSARVTVRQYRSWIQAEQDDGTSYYGRCIGNRLQFDVYSGWSFSGTQNGTISSSSWPSGSSWTPRWGNERGSDYSGLSEAAAAPAVAPAPSPGSRGSQASFTWTTWYGSGSESWTR